jgi:ATP-dependent DNA helicase PIF1
MVRQLLCPALFITFTAADYHWPSLVKYMPEQQFEVWTNAAGDQAARARISREFVRDNPVIVTYHFHRRLQIFYEEVLRVKFNIVDFWHRYEWQARGSTHSHGLYWVDGAPTVDPAISADLQQHFARFWGIHVTGFNPEVNSGPRPHEELPMMQIDGVDLANNSLTLSQAVNRLQLHEHSKTYCLRINKQTKVEECRFDLPDDLRDEGLLAQHKRRNWLWYFPPRNDGMVNKYNRLVTIAWQANTDVSPCTDIRAVIDYVVKYAGKGEKKSESYRQLADHIIPFVNEQRPLQSFVTKLMNKLIGDRDYSAQEVCHELLDLPLKKCSRESVNVDLRPETEHSHLYRVEGEETRRGLSVLEKYKERSAEDEALPYITFLKSHNHHKPYGRRPRANERIVSYFPRYPPDEVEHYGRSKLMLHHPFRDVKDLLSIPDIHDAPCTTYAEAYEECKNSCGDSHLPDGLDDPLADLELDKSVYEATQDDPEEDARNNIDTEWGDLARALPDREGNNIDPEDNLGYRDMDLNVDWSDRVGQHPDLNKDWWLLQKASHPIVQFTGGVVPYEALEIKQMLFYRVMTEHYAKVLANSPYDQLLLQVNGEGGTGKTTVVRSLCAALEQLAGVDASGLTSSPVVVASGVVPFVRAAPTGVASHNIGGRTLPSLFRLPVKKHYYEDLPVQSLKAMQQKFKGVHYLIIDEKSMVGLKQLTWIHRRLQAIKANDEWFGGMNVVIIGDFCQLPPVANTALFSTKVNVGNSDHTLGQVLYKKFNKTITLEVVKRQGGEDKEAIAFRTALSNLRMSRSTVKDWQLLSSRVASKVRLTDEDLTRFETALRIYQKRVEVQSYNHLRLKELNNPVLILRAAHRGHGASSGTTDDAGNLSATIPVSINSRVMLLENIWAECGLFNGAIGTVRDFVWVDSADLTKDALFAVLVAFDGYDGPELLLDPETGQKLVPIFTSTREWTRGTVQCKRTQFPLDVAYAITIHKGQGISVDCAVLSLSGDDDFSPGLTYVAISRVRSLRGLLFEEPFSYQRIKTKPRETTVMRNADYARRQAQEVPLPLDLMPDDDDDGLPPPPPPGNAPPQFELVIRSDPAAHSGVEVPSGFFSGGFTSDGPPLSSDSDTPIGRVQTPLPPGPPLPRYVAGLLPVNLGQYAAGHMALASQDHSQDPWFECKAPAPLCNLDSVPARYRVLPGVDICIWCNNRLPIDTLSRKVWCGGNGGHEVFRTEIDYEEHTFCNTCEESIRMN